MKVLKMNLKYFGGFSAALLLLILALSVSAPLNTSAAGDDGEITSEDYTWAAAETDTDSDEDNSTDGISVSGNVITITANGTLTLQDDITAVIKIAPNQTASSTSDDTVTVTVDLNGHTLTAGSSGSIGSAIYTGYYVDLTISDSSSEEGGVITGGSGYTGNYVLGGGIYAGPYCSVTLTGGTITKCSADFGGGVYINSYSSFNMTGGTITNCSAKNGGAFYGGGDNTVSVSGGTISSCTAEINGGGIWLNKGSFEMSGGTITNCSAASGGGGYLENTSVTLSGGEISGCSAKDGGGVYVKVKSGTKTFTMTGGTITNCSAEEKSSGNALGGGLLLYADDGELDAELSGGTISNCTVSNSKGSSFGGGIAVYGSGSYFVMNGGTVSGCAAYYTGGDSEENEEGALGGGISVVYGSLTVNEGTIANNTANTCGGGIYVHQNSVSAVLYNVVIYDNTASVLGGGIWCCPYGSLNMYVTDGGAVIDNTAEAESDASIEASGDDIAFVYTESGGTMTLASSILGGGTAYYYHDGGVNTSESSFGYGDTSTYSRYSPESDSVQLTKLSGITESVALKTIAEDEDIKEAKDLAKVVITGNSAPWGGGIATNTGMDIGRENEKDSAPGIGKKILADTDGDGDDEELDSYSVNAGDVVTFLLTSNVPDYLLEYVTEDSSTYVIVFHDVLDSSFTLNETSFTVTVSGVTVSESYYTLTTDCDDGCTFELSIDLAALYNSNVISDYDVANAAEIAVTYEATLSGSAGAGDYTNKAWVEYEGTKTEKPEVDVYVYGIKIYKADEDTLTTDDDGNAIYTTYLSGATFTLYSDEGCTTAVKELTTDENGYLCFDGLAAGTYYLVETASPDGYVGSSAAVTITLPGDGENLSDYYYEKTILNAAIPETGGVSTNRIFLSGLAVVLIAGSMLFLSGRRKRIKEQ